MGDQSKRARGQWGEDRATAHLRRCGHTILTRNWRSPEPQVRGELDIVSKAGSTLVFTEVKARRSAGFGGAVRAVGADKQEQIRRLAASWLRVTDEDCDGVRFDVVAIDGVRLEHLERAF